MKKITILLIIFGIWTAFALEEAAYAANNLLPDAGVFTFVEKPNAPVFEIEDLEGKQVKLQDFRGSAVLLFFWTTW
jgi:cytochrome oxidase Cu insertion factor (SCO1/SenC/PrrC family)